MAIVAPFLAFIMLAIAAVLVVADAFFVGTGKKAEALVQAVDQDAERAATRVELISLSYVSPQVEVVLRNTGQVGIRDFPSWDVWVDFYEADGTRQTERLSYTSAALPADDQWTVEGIYLDAIYFCPHIPEDNCSCRKPTTGLLDLAAKELDFDPKTSFVIGDNTCDIELGHRAEATTFLVRTGYGAQLASETNGNPNHIVDGLSEAAQAIEEFLDTNKKTLTDGA